MSERIVAESLSIDRRLFEFVEREALPNSGISGQRFWSGYAAILRDFAPRHREMCERRDELQQKIDGYHVARRGKAFDAADYRTFLESVGYILPEPDVFAIKPASVDPEIASISVRNSLCPCPTHDTRSMR